MTYGLISDLYLLSSVRRSRYLTKLRLMRAVGKKTTEEKAAEKGTLEVSRAPKNYSLRSFAWAAASRAMGTRGGEQLT